MWIEEDPRRIRKRRINRRKRKILTVGEAKKNKKKQNKKRCRKGRRRNEEKGQHWIRKMELYDKGEKDY